MRNLLSGKDSYYGDGDVVSFGSSHHIRVGLFFDSRYIVLLAIKECVSNIEADLIFWRGYSTYRSHRRGTNKYSYIRVCEVF